MATKDNNAQGPAVKTDEFDRNKGNSPENRFSDGSNQGAHKPGGDAMVTTPPGKTATPPPVTEPVTRGAINTSEGGSGQTSGEMAAEENAKKAADLGQAVLHDEDGKPLDKTGFEGGAKAAGLVSRDERHDSIDRNTGTLHEEALAARQEHGIVGAGNQIDDPDGSKAAKAREKASA